ncbi:YkvA family protein [Imperialibacter roseus]|uniref:YkvA family protein n=1 Tax=Imperialibacter roseus TaxID=1324217 RepID=A0ABZ0IKB1_9BACT|nr:YkvA family protein [Imperialibacter roseus]WOK05116.1 YkvA family protein [Imperialibacter roseus]|tara:strand:- start:15475 stop:15882 length:408 start_codon:yes stop_codon:yes gene_type:complete
MEENKEKKALSSYEKKAERVLRDGERVDKIIGSVSTKLGEITRSNEKLSGFVGRIKVISRMVKNYISGNYRVMPWKSIVLLVAGLIYFITPIDLIPDFIPALGLIDDISMIAFIYRSLKQDIDEYLLWERDNFSI